MAHDEGLAERVRMVLAQRSGISERRMFGGVCFMINGNMACGVANEDLMLRLGNELAAEALKEAHVRPMDFTKRIIKSMVFIAPEGLESDQDLEGWINRAAGFTLTLPAK